MGRTWVRVRFVVRIYAAVRTSIPLGRLMSEVFDVAGSSFAEVCLMRLL